VNRFVSYKDVNHVDADFLSHQLRLLDWGALYETPNVDLQVNPWMTLEIWDDIRWRDRSRC
jgi:hypothetical protein